MLFHRLLAYEGELRPVQRKSSRWGFLLLALLFQSGPFLNAQGVEWSGGEGGGACMLTPPTEPCLSRPPPPLSLCRSCQSLSSLFSGPVSPAREAMTPLPGQSSTFRPPLRALYDLLIGPMEGVRGGASPAWVGILCQWKWRRRQETPILVGRGGVGDYGCSHSIGVSSLLLGPAKCVSWGWGKCFLEQSRGRGQIQESVPC